MTTTLSEGVKVPDVGSVNWAGDLEVNWNLLNGALANLSGNVKTDRDNTWTGEQSFTLPIVGSITGTASKAIADEDGTSIKTGYVNVAGNQTVTGSKDWSNLQTFSYSQIRIKSLSQEIGVTPSTSVIQYLEFADKNNVQHGKVGLWDYDNGASEIQLSILDKYKNGVKDATGTSDTAFLSFGFQYNGTKFITFSGQLNNGIIPLSNNAYPLGSSSYQWSSVYAQNYYYNGTAWGLDIDNHWKRTQILHADTTIDIVNNPSNTIVGPALYWQDNNRFWAQYVPVWSTDGSFSIELGISNWTTAGNQGYWTVCTKISKDFGTFDFYTTHGAANLGTSTNKWKTLNGVNPGALSLPDFTSETGVSLSAGANTYTPVLSGWLSISTTGDISVVCGNFCHKATDMISVPVIAGKTYTVTMPASATGYFYSCLGNV